MKLTKARRETLEACLDWSAPYEVAARRRERGSIVYAQRAEAMLKALRAWGLVKYGAANNTYRITVDGLKALKP